MEIFCKIFSPPRNFLIFSVFLPIIMHFKKIYNEALWKEKSVV